MIDIILKLAIAGVSIYLIYTLYIIYIRVYTMIHPKQFINDEELKQLNKEKRQVDSVPPLKKVIKG
jgi:hypothetical protein